MSVSLLAIALAAGWLILAMLAACVIYQRRIITGPGPERAFVLAGTLLIGVAPSIRVVVIEAGGGGWFLGGGVQVIAALLMFATAIRIRRQRKNGVESILHFPEKSAWLVLAALIVVYGSFVVRIWIAGADAAAAAFLQSIAVFIAVMIVGHAIIALFHAPIEEVDHAPDERDRRISLKSSRNAYYLLFVGFWSLPVMVLAQLSLPQLLVGWFTVLMISELLFYSSVIYYYRFGSA